MSTYSTGYSKSLNAEVAESEGRLPMTRAIPVVAERAGVTRREARAALVATHDGEWHHTGTYSTRGGRLRGRRTDYYDVQAAVAYLSPGAAAEYDRKERESRITELRSNIAELSERRNAYLIDADEWESKIGDEPQSRQSIIDGPLGINIRDREWFLVVDEGELREFLCLSNRRFAEAKHGFAKRGVAAWERAKIDRCTQIGADAYRRKQAAACRRGAESCERTLESLHRMLSTAEAVMQEDSQEIDSRSLTESE